MKAVALDLARWFWRLVPVNPILVRVVFAGGRRTRHLWIRMVYLAVLAVIVAVGVITTQSGSGSSSLADLAKSATLVFKYVSYAQLTMVCLLAPIFAAAAITQERDAQTYNILLSTPLSNAQIVFGSLLSRMYFVFVLLLAGLPLFCVMMVYGGVTLREIALSTGLAAASALAAGALAISISVIRVGTRKTIFSFYFFVAFYLMALMALSRFSQFMPAEAVPAPGEMMRMSWLAPLHPLLALWAVLGVTPAPGFGEVAHYGFPWSYMAAYPAQSFMVIMFGLSVLFCGASVLFVRAGVKEGEPVWYNRLIRRGRPDDADESGGLRRRPRHVWTNAVAWREAMTGASGRGRTLQRVVVIAAGLMAVAIVIYFYGTGQLVTAQARLVLKVMIAIELGLSMLVATNTAATSLTREKEGGTLDTLLVTPMVSRDILSGKIRGLVSFAVPMIGVPFASVLMFVLYDLLKGRYWTPNVEPVVYPEVLLTLPIMMFAFAAFACALGLQASVKARRTVQAVVQSVGALILICAITGGCFYAVASANAELGAVFMPFSPIPAALIVVDPRTAGQWASTMGAGGASVGQLRLLASVAALVSAAVYCGIAYGMYKSMVRNFDMIIRKQIM
ncbi:MAG: ABC transporter permease subunit [Phycisphaerae bacterium]